MSSKAKRLLVAVLVALGHVVPAQLLYTCPMTGKQGQRTCCCSTVVTRHCADTSLGKLESQEGPPAPAPAALGGRCCLVSRSPADAPPPAPQPTDTDGLRELLSNARLVALIDGFQGTDLGPLVRYNFDRHWLDPGSRQAPSVPAFLAHCALLI